MGRKRELGRQGKMAKCYPIEEAYYRMGAKLLEADGCPNWWLGKTPVEVYVLKKAQCAWLAVISHALRPM